MEEKENKSKFIPQGKQRLIFLGTVLIGLVLFYFGIDTWLKQQSAQNPPPPVVIKPVAPIKPAQEEKTESQKMEQPKKSEEPKKVSQTQEAQEKVKEVEKLKTVAKRIEPQKRVIKTYKFQVGSFKYKKNAYRMKRLAEEKGFKAEVVKWKEFYRVYVYVDAQNLREAKRKVLSHFKEALYVRK